jgi:hypothetical protein
VKAVVAQSFERIHRSNLVGMGVLPCQFKDGTSARSLAIDGTETFDLIGLGSSPQAAPGGHARHPAQGWPEREGAGDRSASTRRSRWSTTSTAASCRTC